MRVLISSKNISVKSDLKDMIEKKMDKLSKYFQDDIVAKVMVSKENKMVKLEATIVFHNTVFRSESRAEDIFATIDIVVDKLSKQMSKFKDKLVHKHRGQSGMNFEALSEIVAEDNKVEDVVRRKEIQITSLSYQEAIMEMELLDHSFYVFHNRENDNKVSIIYKREQGAYGLLEIEK